MKALIHIRHLLIATLLGLVHDAKPQQDPLYSMYMWNMMSIMPGYAGSADVLNVTALSRMQWTNINGAPVTHSLSAHSPIDRHNLGLGGSLVHDRIGRTTSTSAFADFSYRVRIAQGTRLAFGLNAGLNHATIANTRVENTDPNDPTFQADQSARAAPNFGFGLYLWSRKGYFGLSAPKLLRNYLGVVESDGLITRFHQEAPHGFLVAGYVLPMGHAIKFRPSIMMRASEGAPISTDLSANFFFHDRFNLGATYRMGNSLIGMFAVQVNEQIRTGYAYDVGTSPWIRRAGGAHEIMVSYDPVFTKQRIRSPRYF